MEEELKKKIEEQGKKIDAIYISVEKTRKYFVYTFWITVIAIVLPLIGMVFVLPSFFSNYTDQLKNLGL